MYHQATGPRGSSSWRDATSTSLRRWSYRFWVTVFVTENKVWLIEVGGDQDHFKAKIEAAISHAIETIAIG